MEKNTPQETMTTPIIVIDSKQWNEHKAAIQEITESLKRLEEKEIKVPINQKVLSLKEVCQALKIGKATVNRLIYSGKLKSVKIGGKRFVRFEDLEQVMNEGSIQ